MVLLLNSHHHRDSSRLTALRMTFVFGHVILSGAKDPCDEVIEFALSCGFFAPIGTQNDICFWACHPERSEGFL